jgi:hypothetical protein
MFGEKSLIEKCDSELVDKEKYFMEKENRVFFTGTIFSSDYIYPEMDIKRDRKELYNKICKFIYNPGYLHPYEKFLNELRNSKFSLDLLGIGDPNKRTFEILLSGSLMLSQFNNLLWPFNDDESFSEKTIFKNEEEFLSIINNLIYQMIMNYT